MSNETYSQGFELFLIDDLTNPSTPAVVKIGNVTNLGEFGGQADEIETTNLDSVAKEFFKGLADNGEMSLQVNIKKADGAHKLLWKLQKLQPSEGDPRKHFIVCGSDGTDLPTVDTNGTFNPPADREWWAFDAFVKSFRFPVSVNAIVNATTALRLSGSIASSMDS